MKEVLHETKVMNSEGEQFLGVTKSAEQTGTEAPGHMLTVKGETLGSGSSGGFWTFKTMITPGLIQIIFWIGVIACVVVGGMMIMGGYNLAYGKVNETEVMLGLACVFLGPLVVRICCEFLILFFRMNETLTEIKNKLR